MNILFVCTGNTCRSPMAEALMKKLAEEKGIQVNVRSAGIYALDGQRASEEAVHVMEEEGIDISDHRANLLYRNLVEESHLILTMSRSHKEQLLSKYGFLKGKVFTLKEYAYSVEEDIEDPFGRSIRAYQKAKREIKDALKEVIKRLEVDR
ncbi:MAG: low molecular weight protein arginine phosphatase [Tissierellia bacterium]|nr:low molecular weight protein arginine phosphatase [Tissierellia bacterium]